MAGMGCAVTTAVVMLVSLTIVPALLLNFPSWFDPSEPSSRGDGVGLPSVEARLAQTFAPGGDGLTAWPS